MSLVNQNKSEWKGKKPFSSSLWWHSYHSSSNSLFWFNWRLFIDTCLWLVHCNILPKVMTAIVPLEDHPLWATCELINVKEDSKYLFLLTFFIIVGNSFLVDLICYVRILNFMRKNSVRVTVVATSHTERIKAHNIVTAPSSLLIWLVESVIILPSCLLMIYWCWSHHYFAQLSARRWIVQKVCLPTCDKYWRRSWRATSVYVIKLNATVNVGNE